MPPPNATVAYPRLCVVCWFGSRAAVLKLVYANISEYVCPLASPRNDAGVSTTNVATPPLTLDDTSVLTDDGALCTPKFVPIASAHTAAPDAGA